MFCTYCGAKRSLGIYCASCGALLEKLDSSESTQDLLSSESSEEHQSRSAKTWLLLGGIGFVAVIFMIILAIQANSQQQSNTDASSVQSTQEEVALDYQQEIQERMDQNVAACEAVKGIDVSGQIGALAQNSDVQSKVNALIAIAEDIRAKSNQGPDVREAGSKLADSYTVLASAVQNQINMPAELLALINKAHLEFKNSCSALAQ